jgi:hypothetical protein
MTALPISRLPLALALLALSLVFAVAGCDDAPLPENRPPTADLSVSSTDDMDLDVTFDADFSDPDVEGQDAFEDEITDATLFFGNGESRALDNPGEVSYSYDEVGVYTARLEVEDAFDQRVSVETASFMVGMEAPDPTTFTVEVQNVDVPQPVLKSGTFSSPGAGSLGPDVPALFPGESASFTFDAPTSTLPPAGGSGQRLNFATMFVQSNDLFYGFEPEGLALYDAEGNATTGDVTDQVVLYDAGTEEDTAPGTGPDQKPAQDPTAIDQGTDEDETVQPVSEAATNDFDYPDASEVIQVTIEHDGGTQFTVTVENVSTPGTIDSDRAGGSVPLSPGAWAVHEGFTPFTLFTVGEDASNGIELIAEDGFPADVLDDEGTGDEPIDTPADAGLADAVAGLKGLIVPLSPPVYAVHSDGFQPFTIGEPAGEGIETVAEDGFPASSLGGMNLPPTPERALVDILMGEEAVSLVGAAPAPGGNVPALEPAPGGEGETVTFTLEAVPGDRFSLATMFVQSNDYFYGFSPEGVALFDGSETPTSGDLTDQVVLYDAGTEVDEEPGVGPTQKPRQAPTATDVGEDENGVIEAVIEAGEESGTNDGFAYPPTAQTIRVTITPQQ